MTNSTPTFTGEPRPGTSGSSHSVCATDVGAQVRIAQRVNGRMDSATVEAMTPFGPASQTFRPVNPVHPSQNPLRGMSNAQVTMLARAMGVVR